MKLTVTDYFGGSANLTKTFDSPKEELCIVNDGASPLTFTVGALTIPVKAGERVDERFKPFDAVTVATTVTFRAWVRA